jgi:hypothetical protein
MTVYPEIIPGDRSRIINYVVIALMNGIGDAFLALPTIRFIQCIAGPENVHNPRANLGKCHDLRSLAGREDETESIATEPRTSTRVGRPRREDTLPGGAFVFELWKKRKTENYLVRIYYTAQTLEQMRFHYCPHTGQSSSACTRFPTRMQPGRFLVHLACVLANNSAIN